MNVENHPIDNVISVLDGSVEIPFSYFREKAHLGESDVLLVSGTLVEGIGNSQSDLDCLVLCEKRPLISGIPQDQHVSMSDANYNPDAEDSELHNTYDFYGSSGLHVDFDYLLFSEIEALAQKIRDAYADLIRDQRILYEPIMATKEDRFVHRLAVAVAVANPGRFSEMMESFPFAEFCYVSGRELAANYYYYKDVQGTWMAGNWRTAQESARELLISQLRSFLYLNGCTNKHRKWLFTVARQLDGDNGELSHRSADHLLTIGNTSETAEAFIMSTLDLIDELMARSVGCLTSNAAFPDPEIGLAQLEREFAKRPDPDHALSREEFEFRVKLLRPESTRPLTEMLLDWKA